jgi:ubiquinone/menaquinone biosynthesis C-methylase UbiE
MHQHPTNPGPDPHAEQPYDYYAIRYATDQHALQQVILHAVYDDYRGQTSWMPTAAYDRFHGWLDIRPDGTVLDTGCGAGGPALRLVRRAGCAVVGIDVNAEALATATALAEEQGLSERVRFVRHDASQPLPFPDGTFAAVICIDVLGICPTAG